LKHLEDIVMVVAPLGAAILIIFIITKYNYLAKKAIIDKGGDPASRSKYRYLDVGCIIISIGLGLAVSSLISMLNLPPKTLNLLTYATLLVFGGLGLILAHFIRNKFENK